MHSNLLLQIRPAFGGNIIATIVNYDMWPQMATVREGVMPLREPDPLHKAKSFRSPSRWPTTCSRSRWLNGTSKSVGST